MIYGIGTDIIEIDRIKKACADNAHFVKRYYTEREQELISRRGSRGGSFAAMNFAAKEAVAKSLKTGICRRVRLEQIEILRDDKGAPYVVLHGDTLQYAKNCGIDKIHISLSDTSVLAMAYAVAEQRNEILDILPEEEII